MTQQRAIKTRAGVITAAAHEFADRGYAGASINSIIANSTSTKGALYFHFPSKEALAEAVLDNVRAAYSRIAERRRSVHTPLSACPIANRYRCCVCRCLRTQHPHGSTWRCSPHSERRSAHGTESTNSNSKRSRCCERQEFGC